MAQKQLVRASKAVDTMAIISADSDEVAGHMLLTAFTNAYNEVMQFLNDNEDQFAKGTATLPTVTIEVSTVADRISGRESKKRCNKGTLWSVHSRFQNAPCEEGCDYHA